MGLAQKITPTNEYSGALAKSILNRIIDNYEHELIKSDFVKIIKNRSSVDFIEFAIENDGFYIHRSGATMDIYGELIDTIVEVFGSVILEDV